MARAASSVSSPPRAGLLDLDRPQVLSLRDVEILVLDEADQMLDLGFIHALKRIVTMVPKSRQSLFFSATMPNTISSLADAFLRDPAKVAVTAGGDHAERVEQSVIFVSGGRKQALLNTLLQDEAIERALVFTRTKHGADSVVKHLAQGGVEAARSTATSPSRSASGRSPPSRTAAAGCSSRPTSPRAASTWRA
jgi:ATP-dependent RNA helicase RhlE